MNLDRCLLFSWLEEDNIQKAYFRVRPLLTLEGDVRSEAEALWPNEGCLRIVPDRNEQHTFKVRMRTLGSFCVVDLRGQPADAGKIRTNKNFRPDKGEVNQYILYSDTVYALPEHTFYEIVEGTAEGFAEAVKKAVTPLFYIREGDTLYTKILVSAMEDAERIFDISNRLTKGYFEKEAGAVAEKVADLIKRSVPDYLLGEWSFANSLASMPILDSVVEVLIEKGILTPPENGLGAEGCWMYVKKE